MKKWIITIGGLTLLLGNPYIYAQTKKGSFPLNTEIEFTGTIAEQSVLVELMDTENGLTGRYKYLKIGKIIPLEGVIDPQHNYTIELTEGDQEENNPRPTWRAIYQNDSIVGKWYSADHKKTYNIKLGIKITEGVVVDFFPIEKDTVVYTQPKDTTAPSFTYANRLSFPKKEKHPWLADLLRRNNDIKPNQSVEEYLVRDMIKQVKTYQKSALDADHPEYASWNWDYENRAYVNYNEHDYLTICTSGYEYTGGAHGIAWEVYDNYDLKNKHRVRLSDIIAIDSAQISTLLKKTFRKQYDVKPNNTLKEYGLFDDTIKPNNNFYFNDWGLTFIYNQYEIGPYVMGIIPVFIPWEDLKPYLNPTFIERIHL